MNEASAVASQVASLLGQTAREGAPAGSAAAEGAQLPFADVLARMVASANERSAEAGAAGAAFARGAVDDIHGTMIAMKKADIETKLVVSVRNKLLDAWNDLWRMPL